MKIYQLRLINVKSYVDETIEFQPGINFISGKNGAGKSTIIESIGYALFNYNPYVLKQFLRDGAAQGEIQVLIEGLDERLYRVIRKFNASQSSKWEIWDEETSSMLPELHGLADVSLWLKNMMGIRPEDELADLFRQVIAVEQGLFTTPFLEAPGQRKKTFDAILNVEDFRQAFDRTKTLEHGLLKDTASLKEQLEILGQSLVELPEVQEKIALGQGQELLKKGELDALGADLKQTVDHLTICQQQKDDLAKYTKELAVLEERLNGQEGQRAELQHSLLESREAQTIVSLHSEGFKRYLDLQSNLKSLETELEFKRKLEEKIQALKLGLATRTAKLEADEGRHQQDRAELNTNLAAQIVFTRSQEERTTAWEQVQKDFERFAPLGTKHQARLSQVQLWTENFSTVLTGVKHVRERIFEVQEAMAISSEAISELPKWEKELVLREQADCLESNRRLLAEKKAELEALLRNEDDLRRGLCPIIQETCPSDRVAGGRLDEFFQERLEILGQELKTFEDAVADGLEDQKEQALLRTKIQAARLQGEYFEQHREKELGFFGNIKSAFKGLAWELLGNQAQSLKQLLAEYEQDAMDLGGQLKVWGLNMELEIPERPGFWYESPLGLSPATLTELDHHLSILAGWQRGLLDSKESWEHYGQGWQAELSRILNEIQLTLKLAQGAASQAQKELLQMEKKSKELGLEITALQREWKVLGESQKELDVLQLQLVALTPLEETIKATKDELGQTEASYNLYQANFKEAQKLGDLVSRLNSLETASLQLKEQQTQKAKEQANLLVLYSSDAHRAMEHKVEVQKSQFLNLERDLKELWKERQELFVRLARLEDMEKIWFEKGRQYQETELAAELTQGLRQVLRSAADPIAQEYRSALSAVATDLYRSVSGDNVRIEWGFEYELQLVDYGQGKERVRVFRQLSGGEQMTVALAVRLALMQLLSPVNMGFFDEPTTNLDLERRESLAAAIQVATSSFEQLFLISHDDSFDAVSENVISLQKDESGSTTLGS